LRCSPLALTPPGWIHPSSFEEALSGDCRFTL
jgi:hypothetical protein